MYMCIQMNVLTCTHTHTHTHTSPVLYLLNHYPKRVRCCVPPKGRPDQSPDLSTYRLSSFIQALMLGSLSLQKVLSHTTSVAPVSLPHLTVATHLAAPNLLLQYSSTLFWAAPYQFQVLPHHCRCISSSSGHQKWPCHQRDTFWVWNVI